MERNYKVYVHIAPNGKRYYGITKQKVEKRWNGGRGYKEQPCFYNDILLYGWDNFTHEILFDNLTKEEAELMEKFYIALYDTINEEKGYNVSLGYILSEETKAKLSKAMSGENNPNYGKRGELSYWYGKCGKDNPRARQIYCVELDQYFDTVTEASEYVGCGQQNISNVLIGTNSTACGYHWLYANEVNEENINKVMSKEYNTHGNSKRIYCVELDKYFNSITEASKYIGCGHSSISKALTGKQKTCAKGYHFIYAEDVSQENINKVMSEEKYANNKGKNNIMAKQIYCVELDMYFDTITEASKYIGCSISSISMVLRGRSKTAKGMHWVYAEDIDKLDKKIS